MKLQKKIMLSITSIILCLMILMLVYINTVLVRRVEAEKAASYKTTTQQMVASTELITKEIEQSLFNQYFNSPLISKLLDDGPQLNKKLDIENELISIPLNNSNLSSAMLIDLDGNRYFASSKLDERITVYDDVLSQTLNESSNLWLRDQNQNVFLKKEVIQPIPMKNAGTIIVKMDREKLSSAIGLDANLDGTVAIATESGQILMAANEKDISLVEMAVAQEGLSYRPMQHSIHLNNEEYYFTLYPGKKLSWYVIQLVPVDVMLSMPMALSQAIWMGCTMFLLGSLGLTYVITYRLTRNVKMLVGSIQEIGLGYFECDIPVTSRDEIGELAQQFRRMQGKLKALTSEMVSKATEKKNAEYEMLELKYRSFQAQVSPHFICNILSSIDALAVMGRTQDVSHLALEAAKYLRGNLRNADNKYTLLALEVCFVQKYTALYADIYGGSFHLDIGMADDTAECEVPTMLLQPLVENALVHGFPLDDPEQMHVISIRSRLADDNLVITVSDNGQGIGSDVIEMVKKAEADHHFDKKMLGFGLRSVLQRLNLLYGDKQSLQIESIPGMQTVITISIPIKYGYEEDCGS